ncbi:MAG: membrane protein insertase YidC [Azospirillaceae bacterium]
MPDQKNLIIAIALSVAILLGWQFFVEGPRIAEEQARQEAAQQAGEASGPTGVARDGLDAGTRDLTGGPTLGGARSRDAVLEEAPRIRIDTPRLHGSFSLVGAQLDDLTLADYRETVDPDSPEIVLLSPRGAPNPYFADFGWLAAEGVPVPGPDTRWRSDAEVLSPDNPATLTWDNGQGLVFERTVAVDRDYLFTITDRVINEGGETVQLAPYGRVLRFGTPETLGFFILHEGPYGVFDTTLNEFSYSTLRDDEEIRRDSTGGWLGFTDKYWLVSLVPDQQATVDARFSHRLEGDEDRYFSTFRSEQQVLEPGGTIETTNRLFAGAKEVQLIDRYSETYGIENFDLAIDFGWFYFMTKPFFYALAWINGIVGNFGVAILIFTVAIKLVFFPLANKSYKAMSKMKALQPQMQEIRERYTDDRQRMNQEIMDLYKREKVNPASGCLPILIQIPVFFALYKVLFVTIEMRHTPFFGWIQDLSAPDPTSIFNLFGLLPFQPPDPLMIGVWPLIMGVTMFLQQKLNPAPADPIQQKIFMALPIVFTFLLARFPAGLVIYWAWNNTLSIAQQWLIMRRHGVKPGGGTVDKPSEAPPSAERRKKKAEGGAKPAPAGAAASDPARDAADEAADGAYAAEAAADGEPAAAEAGADEAKGATGDDPGSDKPSGGKSSGDKPASGKTAVRSAPRKKKGQSRARR